ncbi:hypothetical protein pb186bvf_019012 [Paramecium bursaria]
MKYIILLLIVSILSQTIDVANQCQCSQILNNNECNTLSKCSWNNSTSICKEGPTSKTLSYSPGWCQSVNDYRWTCPQTFGCAFYDNGCFIFAGCTAYLGTTNDQCQSISNQCTSDGTKCIDFLPCSSYTTVELCLNNYASSGAGQCKWQNKCIDLECTDAPTYLNTDDVCNRFLQNCITNGKGCVSKLHQCSYYIGDKYQCQGYIGSDGLCEGSIGGQNCRVKVCENASKFLNTDQQCSAYQNGCITNGLGCLKQLQSCQSYQLSDNCDLLIGTDGQCTKGEVSCRKLLCTDAPITNIVDAACDTFLSGCITTGQGCIDVLGKCESYTGTALTCFNYKGTDGNCKGAEVEQKCQIRQCVDAENTLNSDDACDLFQKGCITTGKGCVYPPLPPCSTYVDDNCTGYKGIDGSCQGSGQCVARDCESVALVNNDACYNYSYLCVSDGNNCLLPETCDTLVKQISCQGKSSCQYKSVCMDPTSCGNFTTYSLCLNNKQQYKILGAVTKYVERDCWWVNDICQNTYCYQAPSNFNTDLQCDNFQKGCVTMGAGCTDTSYPCYSYYGDNLACNNFTGNYGLNPCYRASGTGIGQCTNRLCTQLTSAVKDQDCKSFMSTCVFNGATSCINISDPCSSYTQPLVLADGDIQTQSTDTSSNKKTTACALQFGLNGTVACWILAGTTGSCIVRQCLHAVPSVNNLFNTNQLCDTFLDGCVTNGSGCVPNTQLCTVYIGTISQCNSFTETNLLGNYKCSKSTNICRQKLCTRFQVDQTQSNTQITTFCQNQINSLNQNCFYNSGAYCQTYSTSCTIYFAQGTQLSDKQWYCFGLKSNDKSCWYTSGDYCKVTACADIPQSQSQSYCDSKVTGCIYDSYQNLCLTKSVCTLYVKYSRIDRYDLYCQSLQDTSNLNCGYKVGNANCSSKSCDDQIFATNDTDCQNYLSGCKYLSNGNCYQQFGACTGYIIPVAYTNNNQKANWCSTRRITSGAQQLYCSYNPSVSTTTCNTPLVACTQTVTGATDNDKQNFCINLVEQNGNGCNYSSGTPTTCVATSTCSALAFYLTGTPTDIQKATQCLLFKDTTGVACPYGGSATVCGSISNNCTSYTPYGVDDNAKFSYCQSLIGVSLCGFARNGSTCSARQCSDITQLQANFLSCSSYLSTCQYDSLNCVAISDCALYLSNTLTLGDNCKQMKDLSGQLCGYVNGSNCKSKQCSDVNNPTSIFDCSSYLSTCTLNGNICIVAGLCSSYQAIGSDQQSQIAYCQQLSDQTQQQCTYINGSNCIVRDLCTNYAVTGTNQEKLQICLMLQDTSSKYCNWASGNTCTNRSCNDNVRDQSCTNYLQTCEDNPTTTCSLLDCTVNTTASSDIECQQFQTDCLFNGQGCVSKQAPCSSYYGDADTCSNFIGFNGQQVCYNIKTALMTDQCLSKTCESKTDAKNNTDCNLWMPSLCVFGGATCVSASLTCTQFTGSFDDCESYSAIDGPCTNANQQSGPCQKKVCTNAPTSLKTDADCQAYHPSCVTSGQGCILPSDLTCQNAASDEICNSLLSTLNCYSVKQCIDQPLQCSDYLNINGCINGQLLNSKLQCGWNKQTNKCAEQTCSDLATTNNTDTQCKSLIATCTTNGQGCVTLGPCSSYDKIACSKASTTSIPNKCTWSNSQCRPIICEDKLDGATDKDCDAYLTGCLTNGKQCMTPPLKCENFVNQKVCLKASSPCYWYGTCMSYSKCQDYIGITHSGCQTFNKYCTTDGTKCIPLDFCQNLTKQISCIIGTDGVCGWKASGGCSLYTQCVDVKGTTKEICQAWNSLCYTDGVQCIQQSKCSDYKTQIACANLGIDGTCFYDNGSCRLQQCSDSSGNTYETCLQFKAKSKCTTDGVKCIEYLNCSDYGQVGCHYGIDGQCLFDETTLKCRKKQCSDLLVTSTCSDDLLKCVRSDQKCIDKALCSEYKNQESCLGGGTDGQCAFIPLIPLKASDFNSTTTNSTNSTNSTSANSTTNSTTTNSTTNQINITNTNGTSNVNLTTNNGTCQLFTKCSDSNQDYVTCKSKSSSCQWTAKTDNGTFTTSCSDHTCQTKALGSVCYPIPSFDGTKYQICIPDITSICVSGDPASLNQGQCFNKSAYSYTWSTTNNVCQSCVPALNTTQPDVKNDTNTTNQTSYAFMLKLLLFIL